MTTGASAGMAAALLASSLAVAGKTPKPKPEPYTQIAVTPAEDQARGNPLANDPNAIAAGRKLYERHCGSCHGDGGEYGRQGPSLRVTEIQNASEGALFWAVTNGNVRAGMPVWSKLPEPQRWQIGRYLKSLGSAPSDPRAGDPTPAH
jgi:mono/diheme cytochrome c family protein